MTDATFDPRLAAIAAEDGFGADLFDARRHACCELVDAYVAARAAEVAVAMDLDGPLAHGATFEALQVAARLADGDRPLRWLLAWLVERGYVERRDDTFLWRADRPAHTADELRARALAIDPSYAPAFALADETALAYPKVVRGETSGERALFMRIALWESYFNNAHGYYALNNRVTAHAAADRLPANGPLRVLELGAGLGSGSEALLEALQARGAIDRLTGYHFTEPVPFFRRRAERALTKAWPTVPWRFGVVDVTTPFAAQADCPADLQLVWAVNVLHLAPDLDATLTAARDLLAPGGWLVAGEGIRPVVGHPVAAEFPFQLLESFSAARLDPATRPEPGFLTGEHWLAAFRRAGFANVRLVPDAIRLRAVHSTFYAAAVCGQRPA